MLTLGGITESEWDVLQERQKLLESESLTLGEKRFRKRLEKAQEKGRGSTEGAARVLQKKLLLPMEEGLDLWVEQCRTMGKGKRHQALRWVEMLGSRTVAFLVVRTVLNSVHTKGGTTLQKITGDLCRLMMDEARFRRFEERAPGLFKYKIESFSTTSYAHMARSLSWSMGKAACATCTLEERSECPHLDVGDLTIPPAQYLAVGTKLLDLLLTSTVDTRGRPAFEKVVRTVISRGKRKDGIMVRPCAHVVEWVDKHNAKLALLSPVQQPMVVPPLQWAPGQRGGYLYALRNRNQLARGSTDAGIERADMPLVYDALNRIQETPWRINGAVLAVIEEIEARRGGMAGVPELDKLPEPPKPLTVYATEQERRESKEWRKWNKEAGAVKDAEVVRIVEARGFNRVLHAAQKVRDEGAIWFPYNLDFRGRVYPIADALSPQGDDIQKGLLTFAQGTPMGSQGGDFLAVHGMNCLDVVPWGPTGPGTKTSKWTLAERIEWVRENSEAICSVADDPFTNRWWMESTVDHPFQFLAFCYAWAAWAHDGFSPEHVCSLPVAQDGSCNGLQHFSAMFRDEVGGRAVNVVPQERPQDIYARVSEVVTARLQADVADESKGAWVSEMRTRKAKDGTKSKVSVSIPPERELARLWLESGLVNRSLCKRPTMTFGYGSKRFGFVDQIAAYLAEKNRKEKPGLMKSFALTQEEPGDFPAVPQACGYMARLIWESLGEVVDAAQRGMGWMQQWARLVSRTGKTLEWTVPLTGFRVRQGYFQRNKQQVKTILAGSAIWPVRYTNRDEIEAHRQVNGVAPNVIHSLDAAALMLTVNQAAAEGVEMFAMVHDSYGTTPGDAALLARCTRQAFVRLYREEVAESLVSQWREQAQKEGEEIEEPVPVPFGRLDLSGVLVSDYFFA